jgi:serine/threonine-protein kinase
MGVVYVARDLRLDRLVAIKTLPAHLADDPAMRERFIREARTAGRLNHPNIVSIHRADELAGQVFFVMGFVDGDSLAARIRARGHLASATVRAYLRDASAALAHAHSRGVIHRDVKPENMLIDRASDRVIVTDFGIARMAETAPLTATGQVLGTVHYVSPEQASGDTVDHRSDLYSLGVVGYLALSGRLPFDSLLASAVLIAHVNKKPAALASVATSVSPALAAIIDRLLAKDPAHRYDSAEALCDALDGVDVSGQPVARVALVSDTEAHEVWRRAAELEEMTGARPMVMRDPRDHSADRARTSGLAIDDVREAARGAGIGTASMNRALAERGLAGPPGNSAPAQIAPQTPFWRQSWAGTPLMIVEEASVAGKLHPDDFASVVNLARQATGTNGTPHSEGRELGWHFNTIGQRLHVRVAASEGRTRVYLVQNITELAAVTTVTAVVAGLVVWPIAMEIALQIGQSLGHTLWPLHRLGPIALNTKIRLAWWAGAIVVPTSIGLGRRFIRWSHDRAAVRLRGLMEAITTRVEECITRDQPRR